MEEPYYCFVFNFRHSNSISTAGGGVLREHCSGGDGTPAPHTAPPGAAWALAASARRGPAPGCRHSELGSERPADESIPSSLTLRTRANNGPRRGWRAEIRFSPRKPSGGVLHRAHRWGKVGFSEETNAEKAAPQPLLLRYAPRSAGHLGALLPSSRPSGQQPPCRGLVFTALIASNAEHLWVRTVPPRQKTTTAAARQPNTSSCCGVLAQPSAQKLADCSVPSAETHTGTDQRSATAADSTQVQTNSPYTSLKHLSCTALPSQPISRWDRAVPLPYSHHFLR